jgi:hypothetical protein
MAKLVAMPNALALPWIINARNARPPRWDAKKIGMVITCRCP